MHKQTIFTAGDGGYASYRIPTCIALPSGRVISFCEGRLDSLSDYGCIRVLARISDDGGKTFGPAFIAASDNAHTVGNPCPVYDRETGRLFLLLNGNRADGGEHLILQGKAPRSVYVCESDDMGSTWSPLRDITPSVKPSLWTWHATGPCHALQLRSGRLIVPCNHAVLDPQSSKSGPYISGTLYSDDHGKTWHAGADIVPETNECSLAELSDGNLYMNMRSYAGKNRRAAAVSRDEGATWQDFRLDDTLIEPVCQGSVISVPGTDTLYFTNPASTSREKLTIRKSMDGGRTWAGSLCIHSGPAAYSDIALLPDGTIFVLYECGVQSAYEQICAAYIDPAEII